ncbi:NUDIX hydrolase [candidate division WWE3 bacterium]|uniref:NUDIX hydrolase n=1 Tax=candidate division WWE3 bacterium TaxID=2053526 RepID=A0A955LK52_UNCKA|nr:NUDIX hydrolase [candidate division WWE3 bacterium]
MKNPWITRTSKIVYENSWIKVVEDEVVRPDGSNGIYGVVSLKSNGGYIVAVNDEGKTPLVRLFRYPTQTATWEFPSGGVDKDDPESGVKAELGEETGFSAAKWTRIGGFYSMAGIGDEYVYVFLAQGLKEVGNHKQSEEGITEVMWVDFDEIDKLIENGEFIDGPSIAAFYLVRRHLRNVA